MSRFRSQLVLAVMSGLVLTGLGAAPSQAGASPRSATFAQGGAVSAAPADAARKKKHKKHKKRKKAGRCSPASARALRTPGSVTYSWGRPCAGRYRVHVSPAPWGKWPGGGGYTPWVSGASRSTTYRVPTTPRAGDGMIAVPYGNPVFGQVESRVKKKTRRSTWITQWPQAPAPAAGDAVRFGSYNLKLWPTDSRNIAAAVNIGSHGLTMVALQEARQSTASELVSHLNASYPGQWAYVQANGANNYDPDRQIVYRSDLFSLVGSGVYRLSNPQDSRTPIVSPYASFRAKRAGGSLGNVFHVTSVHMTGSASSKVGQNAQTGAAAQAIASYLRGLSGPVILAGDLQYGREPYGDRPGYVPAQPTFVRNGYYDAMASQSIRGQNYSTFNDNRRQAVNPSGSAARSDHILMRGITGSLTFTNVANWSYRGVIPSDHNLVFTDIRVP